MTGETKSGAQRARPLRPRCIGAVGPQIRVPIYLSFSPCCKYDKTGWAALFQYLYGSSCRDRLWLFVTYTGPFSRRDQPTSREYLHNGYNGPGAHTKTETVFHYTDTMTLCGNVPRGTQRKIYRRVANTVCCFVRVLSNINDGEQTQDQFQVFATVKIYTLNFGR
jgi:hypothetical protein